MKERRDPQSQLGLHRHTDWTLDRLARWIGPIVRGWLQYYCRFYRTELYALCKRINTYLVG